MKRETFVDKIKTGDKFGYLKTISYDKKKCKWLCKCKCGKMTYVHSSNLFKGIQKSCNCGLGQLTLKNGDIFGNLTVLNWDKKKRRWKCICKCGKITYACTSHLHNGNKKGCGCLIFGPRKTRMPNNLALKNVILKTYKRAAEKRKHEFNLTNDEFFDLIQQNCFYCGHHPSTSGPKYFEYYDNSFKYNGIDRKNNNEGYTLNNCVPCCFVCNHAKSKMTLKQFRRWIKQIYDKQYGNF